MVEFFIVLSGNSLDRKIDFSERNVLLPTGYFFSKSRRALTRNPYIPECKKWFLDSGGFSLLTKWHDYPFSLDQYVWLIKRKKPDYAAVMDYPCEPELTISIKADSLCKNINLSVDERIDLTIKNTEAILNNYDIKKTKILPVIQGWNTNDYRRCIDLLHKKELLSDYVAFGSMCRRMSLNQVRKYVVKLTDHLWGYVDAKVHFFGFKLSFLKDIVIQERVYSCDSAAWTHNLINTGRQKNMYHRNQKELERNFYFYMQKIDKILKMFEGQQKLEI